MQHLHQSVRHKFPDAEEVPYTAVSGFLFLRYFCAAILGPKLFGLWPTHPAHSKARSLTLVAKTLQVRRRLRCLVFAVSFCDAVCVAIVRGWVRLFYFTKNYSSMNTLDHTQQTNRHRNRTSPIWSSLAKRCAVQRGWVGVAHARAPQQPTPPLSHFFGAESPSCLAPISFPCRNLSWSRSTDSSTPTWTVSRCDGKTGGEADSEFRGVGGGIAISLPVT